MVNVTGNADPSGFFSSPGLRSGYPGGQLALSLDVTCAAGVGAVPGIAAADPSGTVNSAGLTGEPTTAAVPEPRGMALLGCVVVALGIWRRREFGVSA